MIVDLHIVTRKVIPVRIEADSVQDAIDLIQRNVIRPEEMGDPIYPRPTIEVIGSHEAP